MTAPDLKAALSERLDAATPPAGDLDRARREGRRRRRRRRAGVAISTASMIAAASAAGFLLAGESGTPEFAPDEDRYASLGPMDFSDGLQAYADPGGEVHLGGKTLTWDKTYAYFDTDATATPSGIVFYDAGRPMLLDETGTVSPLVDGPVDDVEGFHPTAKADAHQPLVAWATLHDGTATITAHNLETGDDVASTEVECGGSTDERCSLVIDGIDSGVVFVRDAEGTRTWNTATGQWQDFAGPKTRVADVRGGVVLHVGPAPTSPGPWRVVKGAIDAQLSFDGEYVLYWSSRLEPTTQGKPPIELDVGVADDGGGSYWTFDTDGSVLVATTTAYPEFTVYDCELPAGTCTELGPLETTGGDPMFIGNDM